MQLGMFKTHVSMATGPNGQKQMSILLLLSICQLSKLLSKLWQQWLSKLWADTSHHTLTAKERSQSFSLTRHTHSSRHLIWIWLFKTAQILDPGFALLVFIFNTTWNISVFRSIQTHRFPSVNMNMNMNIKLITHIPFKNSGECSWNSIWLRKSSITPNFFPTGWKCFAMQPMLLISVLFWGFCLFVSSL